MLPAILLFLVTLSYFFPLLSSKHIFIERDLAVFFIPPKYLWVNLLKNLDFPLWNPHQYSGIPLLATLQPAVFYPPHILYLFLPFNIVWNWLIILHFFFSALTTYLLLRHLKASKPASLTSALILLLSGYMLSVHNLLPHLFSVCFFPLVILNLLKYFERGKLRYLFYSALSLTMQFLAGAPEIVIMTVLVALILFLVFFRKNLLYGIRPFLLFLLLFFLLSSAQLLPFLELHFHSIRKSGLSFQEATIWSFSYRDFLLFFMPDAFGSLRSETKYWQIQSWLKTVYLGFSPFCLSVFYFLSQDKKKPVILLFIFLSFFFSLGRFNPLYRFIYHIPPFNSVRYPVKFLFLFFFSISVSAGLGLDRMKEGLLSGEKKFHIASKVIFYTGFFLFLLFAYIVLFKEDVKILFDRWGIKPDGFNDIEFNIHNLRRFLFFAFLISLVPIFYLNLRFKRPVIFLAVLIAGADLFLSNYGYYNHAPWSLYIQRTPIVDALSKDRDTYRFFVTPKTQETFKFFPMNKFALGPYFASLYGLYSIDGSEVMRVFWHDRFLNLIKGARTFKEAKRYLEIAGVRYVISSKRIKDKGVIEKGKFEVQSSIKLPSVYLYELPSSKRPLLLRKALYCENEERAAEILKDKRFDPETMIVIEGKKAKIEMQTGKKIKGEAKIVSYRSKRVKINVRTEEDAFLFLSDTYFPGWKAYIDGKKTQIFKADIAFRAVFVPKGTHEVLFVYRPLLFFLGLFLSLFGVLFGVILWKR